ncbi:DUF6596 domain-containing protein, partial [Rhizobium ruizarguesonis]
PNEPEAVGLLSLMLHCEARRIARRDSSGRYVPLDDQDTAAWNAIMIAEADALLRKAGSFDRFGPFQFQAATSRRSSLSSCSSPAAALEALP